MRLIFLEVVLVLLGTVESNIPYYGKAPSYQGSHIQGPSGPVSGPFLSGVFSHEAQQLGKAVNIGGEGMPQQNGCPALKDVANAVKDASSKGKLPVGATVKYTCEEGYKQAGGDKTRTCKADLKWTGTDIVCKVITCPTLSAPARTTMAGNNNRYGGEISFSCASGTRRHSGSTTRSCGLAATWSGIPLVCVKDCSKLDIANAVRTGSVFKYNAQLTFACKTGAKYVSGDKDRTCKADGTWSGSNIVCKDITCPTLTAPARTSMTNNNNNNKYDAKISFKCVSGGSRQQSGSTIRTCRLDGTWSGTPLVCVKDCSKLDITNAVRTGSVFRYNSKLTFACKTGAKYVSGDKVRTCQADGTWSGSNIVCKEPPKCSSFKAPSGSAYFIKFSGTTLSEGSKAIYTCSSGYAKTCGDDTKVCKTGKWTGTVNLECADVIALWKFNNTDSRVRKRNAVFQNTGKLGMGLSLTGRSYSYAEVRRVDISRTSFTLNFFMKQTGKIGAWRTVFSDWTSYSRSRWQFILQISTNNKMYMHLRRNKYNTGSDPRQGMISVATTNRFDVVNQWYAVAFVWDRSKRTGTFHVDGQRQTTVYSTRSDTVLQDSRYKTWYQVGYKGDSYSQWFQGQIVGLSIYGDALSDRCISAIHDKKN